MRRADEWVLFEVDRSKAIGKVISLWNTFGICFENHLIKPCPLAASKSTELLLTKDLISWEFKKILRLAVTEKERGNKGQ